MEDVEVLIHSSIRITGEKIIYIDPFKINKQYNDADFVFITHDHYDHYSEDDIAKVKARNTIYIVPEMTALKLLKKGISDTNIIPVASNKIYNVAGLKFETIPAYNTNKQFHPKENGWLRIYY